MKKFYSVMACCSATVLFLSVLDANAQTVTTFAGSGQADFADGNATTASFQYPTGIIQTPSGLIYIADSNNSRIRRVTSAGVVSTVAGSSLGYADGFGEAAQFFVPYGLALNSVGVIFVADRNNNRIRKVTAAGHVSTFAGNANPGTANGTGTAAQFNGPSGLALDANGNLFVADTYNHRIRKITADGVVTDVAGSTQGFAEGNGANAQFRYPIGIAVTSTGVLYVADSGNERIRKIDTNGNVTTLAGSDWGYADGNGADAKFWSPTGLTLDAAGNLIVADKNNNRIRKVTPNGQVTTLAGDGTQGYADGNAMAAKFYAPDGVLVEPNGTIVVVDSGNQRIRKLSNALDVKGITREKVSVYPNPATSIVHLELAQEEDASVSLFDLDGKRVHTSDFSGKTADLDITALAKGVYVAKITSGNFTATHKIVKQ